MSNPSQKTEIIKSAVNLEFVHEFRNYEGSFEDYCLQEKNLEAMFWIVHINSVLSNPLPSKAVKNIFEVALRKVDAEK